EQNGAPERALDFALREIAAAPNQEEPYRNAIRVYRQLNREEEAARMYCRLIQMLEKVWDRRPTEDTKQVAAGRPAGSKRTSRRELLSVSDHQPSAVTDPASSAADGVATLRIPLTITRFFGREPELASLAELLAPKEQTVTDDIAPVESLVTLTGPGGSG